MLFFIKMLYGIERNKLWKMRHIQLICLKIEVESDEDEEYEDGSVQRNSASPITSPLSEIF